MLYQHKEVALLILLAIKVTCGAAHDLDTCTDMGIDL